MLPFVVKERRRLLNCSMPFFRRAKIWSAAFWVKL